MFFADEIFLESPFGLCVDPAVVKCYRTFYSAFPQPDFRTSPGRTKNTNKTPSLGGNMSSMGSAASLTDSDLKKLQCLNDYFDCGIPLGELVKKYHRSRGTILDWTVKARHAGRKRTATTVQFGPKPNDKSEPLSLFHKRIGLHLYYWRMGLPDPAPANAAIVLGYSRNAYSKIEVRTVRHLAGRDAQFRQNIKNGAARSVETKEGEFVIVDLKYYFTAVQLVNRQPISRRAAFFRRCVSFEGSDCAQRTYKKDDGTVS